jgi:hypothetical protein
MMLPFRTASRLAISTLIPLAFTMGSVASAGASPASHDRSGNVYTVHQILSGMTLTHDFVPSGGGGPTTEPLADPDDITELDGNVFAGFQNDVGPQGQASSDGNLDSTIVELRPIGDPVAQWDVEGKADGVTADPQAGTVIVTVNEDANSSLYTIDPSEGAGNGVTHYSYNEPLPHNGGTDAISIYNGQILISASAPGTRGASAPQAGYPGVYSVTLDSSTNVATVVPLFYDEDRATAANQGSRYGQSVALALTDPDSNEVVPVGARFGGDFMLTSQGDQEQIFVNDAGGRHQSLAVLSLSQSVDDTAWPTRPGGTLYATDSTNDAIDTIVGPFIPGQPLAVATPCGSNSAPATCPAPPSYPANFLATINPLTGQVAAVTVEGAVFTPQGGLLFIPRDDGHGYGGRS